MILLSINLYFMDFVKLSSLDYLQPFYFSYGDATAWYKMSFNRNTQSYQVVNYQVMPPVHAYVNKNIYVYATKRNKE